MEMHIENLQRLSFRNGLAWVSFLVRDNAGAIAGVSLTCLGGRWNRSPAYYYTNDYGVSFQRTQSYIMPDGRMRTEIVEPEMNPEKIAALQELWRAYQEKLGPGIWRRMYPTLHPTRPLKSVAAA
jgi:hypothetical protein